jgi:hypothetical protein
MKIKRAAIYTSVLYGEDFIVESLQSVLPYVDRAFVVMMAEPWGRTEGVDYRGEWVPWPFESQVGPVRADRLQSIYGHNRMILPTYYCVPLARVFDRTREVVRAMGDDRVEIVETYKRTPWNRWGYAVNEVLRGAHEYEFDEVVLIDPDCVFHADQAASAIREWEAHPEYQWASCGQIELWRTPAWQVMRPRSMVSLHRGDLSLISSPEPPAKRERPAPLTHQLAARVHNLGFCVSEQTMRWKHLTALAFSKVVGESPPNPDWLEKKWLSWHPVKNNRHLEVSLGSESAIDEARPYDVAQLPESIRRRWDAGEWSKLEESFR